MKYKEIINNFVKEVERLAEEKMLITGKIEGSHYAAMKELQKGINDETITSGYHRVMEDLDKEITPCRIVTDNSEHIFDDPRTFLVDFVHQPRYKDDITDLTKITY